MTEYIYRNWGELRVYAIVFGIEQRLYVGSSMRRQITEVGQVYEVWKVINLILPDSLLYSLKTQVCIDKSMFILDEQAHAIQIVVEISGYKYLDFLGDCKDVNSRQLQKDTLGKLTNDCKHECSRPSNVPLIKYFIYCN